MKAQVSVYIILVVALLLFFLAYSQLNQTERTPDAEKQQALSEIPFEVQPINTFVTECLYLSAKQTAKRIGEQGGFENMSETVLVSDRFEPTESDAVYLAPDGELIVPYWSYMKSPNRCESDCTFQTETYPVLRRNDGSPSIESELDKGTERDLLRCVDDFKSFRGQGFSVTYETPRVRSTIRDGDVVINLIFPLTVEKDEVYVLEDFKTELKLNMQEIYRLAEEVTKLQVQYHYLEKQMVNILASYGDNDGAIPPFSDAEFEFGAIGTLWSKTKVKKEVQNLVSNYVQLMQAVGTTNYKEHDFGDGISNKMYNDGMRITLSKDYPLALSFSALNWWPLYFDLNCDGELCSAESFSNALLYFLGTQRYQFYYDVSYPVLVEVFDKNAYTGEGYFFRFFLEANIRDNEPMKTTYERFTVATLEETLLCDEGQRNSGNISFTVVDDSGEVVPDVSVFYVCGQESCTVTKSGEDGTVNTQFPVCLGGAISLVKAGYGESQVPWSTFLRQDDNAGELVLHERKEVEVNFVKKQIGRQGENWVYTGSAGEPHELEEFFAVFRQLDGRHATVVEYFPEGGKVDTIIELLPGTYEIEVFSFDHSDIIIPEEEREVEIVGSLVTEEYTMPEIVFDYENAFPSGGIKVVKEITANEIATGKVTIFTAYIDLRGVPENARKVEDMQVLSEWKDLIEGKEVDFIPVFG